MLLPQCNNSHVSNIQYFMTSQAWVLAFYLEAERVFCVITRRKYGCLESSLGPGEPGKLHLEWASGGSWGVLRAPNALCQARPSRISEGLSLHRLTKLSQILVHLILAKSVQPNQSETVPLSQTDQIHRPNWRVLCLHNTAAATYSPCPSWWQPSANDPEEHWY